MIKVSDKARMWMRAQDIPEEYVNSLVHICGLMRYDRCVEKAQRIADRQNYRISDDRGDHVLLPYFFDMMGRYDGQCSDIAMSMLVWIQVSGWLDDLNVYRRHNGKRSLVVRFMIGLAPKFFNVSGTNHFWISLTEDGFHQDTPSQVFVDASLGVIEMYGEDKYVITDHLIDYNMYEREIHYLMPVGRIWSDGTNLIGSNTRTTVLGVSMNKEVAYTFCFATLGKKIVPVMTIRPPFELHSRAVPMVAWDDGSIWNEYILDMSNDVYAEVDQILRLLAGIRWNDVARQSVNREIDFCQVVR
jgi:hypothetical protein